MQTARAKCLLLQVLVSCCKSDRRNIFLDRESRDQSWWKVDLFKCMQGLQPPFDNFFKHFCLCQANWIFCFVDFEKLFANNTWDDEIASCSCFFFGKQINISSIKKSSWLWFSKKSPEKTALFFFYALILNQTVVDTFSYKVRNERWMTGTWDEQPASANTKQSLPAPPWHFAQEKIDQN